MGRCRIVQLSFFFLRRSFFGLRVPKIGDPGCRDHRSRLQSNEVDRTNILAPGISKMLRVFSWEMRAKARQSAPLKLSILNSQLAFTFSPPSPSKSSRIGPMGSRIQLQQRNCSRFTRDFLRRSTFPSSQRTTSRTSGLSSALQELFRIYLAAFGHEPSTKCNN